MAITSTVKDLLETLEDGRKGFEEAADKLSEDGHAAIATRMRDFSAQREKFSAELRNAAVSKGVSIEEDGSLGGALHRGWIDLKAALTGDSAEAVLDAVKTGESHAVEEYDDALEDSDLDAEMRQLIVQQADAVRAARDEVNSLTLS